MASKISKFKGISVALVAAIPYSGTFFLVYEGLKGYVEKCQKNGTISKDLNPSLVHLVASGLGEGCAAFTRLDFY